MPIKPENREKYPDDWKEISRSIREDRAGGRCECRGECGTPHGGRCSAPHGQDIGRYTLEPSWWALWEGLEKKNIGSMWKRVRVILTTAHLDQDPTNNDESNLLAMCQLCHNRLDAPHRARNRADRERKSTGQLKLFSGES